MASSGLNLREFLRRRSVLGRMEAYAVAALISSGPWIWSIVGILAVGVLSLPFVRPSSKIAQFQASVTYLIAVSQILSGPLQLALTRFAGDRVFEHRSKRIVSNLHGAMLLATVGTVLVAVPLASRVFALQTFEYRALMVAGFAVMCNVWIVSCLASSMKVYVAIMWAYTIGYLATVIAAVSLSPFGLEGLLLGFVIGQSILLAGLLWTIYRESAGIGFLATDFLRKDYRYPSLMLIGLLYYLAFWIDKFIFWYAPGTGQAVIGPLRTSTIYDTPVFLAYLSIIPGMAVFMLRIETDFSHYYEQFYSSVREGAPLQHLEKLRNSMVHALRSGLFEIVKVQAITMLLLFAFAENLLTWLGISTLYLPLLYIQVVAAGLQVFLMAILSVFFYLDRRRIVLALVGGLTTLNAALTVYTLAGVPALYGYGLAGSMLLMVLVALHILDRKLDLLEYETFMLQ